MITIGDYEREFTGNRQIDITHFYCVDEKNLIFSFGYYTPDGVYHSGVVRYNSIIGFGLPEQLFVFNGMYYHQ